MNNREDFAENDLACSRSDDCQLINDHADECDPRVEQERWLALHAAFARIDLGAS